MTSILELLPEEEKEKLILEVVKLIKERSDKERKEEQASKETVQSIVNNIV